MTDAFEYVLREASEGADANVLRSLWRDGIPGDYYEVEEWITENKRDPTYADDYACALEVLYALNDVRDYQPPADRSEAVREAIHLAFNDHIYNGLCADSLHPDSRDDACVACWKLRILSGESIPEFVRP